MGEQTAKAPGLNRAKTYQLVLFPLNNGATNVYYVLVLSYIATFGSKVLALSMIFASVMVTGMRLFDAITDPIIGALMDRTNGKFGKFRPFMVIGNLIMAASILVLYCLTPLIPASSMFLRYAAFVALYAVWVIGYTFQTSCTRSGQTVLTNDPKQRPLFTASSAQKSFCISMFSKKAICFPPFHLLLVRQCKSIYLPNAIFQVQREAVILCGGVFPIRSRISQGNGKSQGILCCTFQGSNRCSLIRNV